MTLSSVTAEVVLTIRRVFTLPSNGLNDVFNEIQSEDRGGRAVDHATAWRPISQPCLQCGEPLLGRTVTTELAHAQTPINVHTETRCANTDCSA